MCRMVMDEDLVFDACALIEEIAGMDNLEEIGKKAARASDFLNQALEGGEKIEENHCSMD